MWVELAAAYVIGTAAGLWLFKNWVSERIVTATLDTLIRDGYLYSWVDEDGITQLTKWSDIHKTDMTPEEIERIVDELIEEDKRRNETDDTP